MATGYEKGSHFGKKEKPFHIPKKKKRNGKGARGNKRTSREYTARQREGQNVSMKDRGKGTPDSCKGKMKRSGGGE